MSRFHTGLVVGKFCPLHRGHEYVLSAARAACARVVILSYTRPELPGCPPERRAHWLTTRFPWARVLVLAADNSPLPIPDNSADDATHRAFCAAVLQIYGEARVDAIFTSEAYGPGFAADLAQRQAAPCTHVAVDPARATVPVSGTALRAAIHRLRHQLAAEVYADFVQRVALLGGESTGKSTLATALADAYSTRHVSEYGRELWVAHGGRLEFADMLAIADEQVRQEEAALRSPGVQEFLFCDTTPLTTAFYSHDLFGRVDPRLAELTRRPYAFTLLCGDEFPHVQDGTRREPAYRAAQQARYRAALMDIPHHELRGSVAERINVTHRVLRFGAR
jgi:HTH-type transcriptional regulator, transcriptional repressor of NAD biosynthesis genes